MEIEEPYTKHVMNVPNNNEMISITAIVMNEQLFNEFCDSMLETPDKNVSSFSGEKTSTKDLVKKCKEAGNVPMICKGTKTEKFFTKYEVETQFMTVVKRGFANKKLKDIITVPQEEAKKNFDNFLEKQTPKTKEKILASSKLLFEEVKLGLRPEFSKLLIKIIYEHSPDIPRTSKLELAEQACVSIINTMSVWTKQFGDPFTQDVKGYLQRIVIGIVVANENHIRANLN